MRKARVKKIVLNKYGSYLGMEKGCFLVKHKGGEVEKYPLFEEEIGEAVLQTGNTVSVGALASLGFWEIDTLFLTARGKPVAMLRSLEYDSHVKTRLCQYEACGNGKAPYIAKQLVTAKLQAQKATLNKHHIHAEDKFFEEKIQNIQTMQTDNLNRLRLGLTATECHSSRRYFRQIFELLPEWLRPGLRLTHKTYDGLNNIFNLSYELLKWKTHIALVRARLEPYLGFLHSLQWGKPSLVCDFQELYRHLIDDFLIDYCQTLKKNDFVMKWEDFSSKRKGKRQYLNNLQTKNLIDSMYEFFQRRVEIPRIRGGENQKVETLIAEEALLFAKYLRDERETWVPRVVSIPKSALPSMQA
jgi:CRISPR-associated protein Cas1